MFDAGVQDISGLGPKGPLRNLLNEIDAPEQIEWRRVRHLYWKNGIRVDAGTSAAAFVDNLRLLFEDERAAIEKFFIEMEAIFREMYADVAETGGIPRPPALSELRSWPERHRHMLRWMKTPFDDMLGAFFQNESIRKLLCTLSEYITDTPRNLLVADMAPLFGYYFDGGCYPAGGSQRFANLLTKAVRHRGGRILMRTGVERILIENGHVTGVTTSRKKSYFAPLVIANGDVVSMLTELVDPSYLPADYAKRITGLGRGPSAILLSLGLSTVLPLPPRIFIQQDGLEFGIGNPSVIDSSLAPKDHSSLTILCLLSEQDAALWHCRDGTYQTRKETFAERLLAATEASVIPDIRKHIVHCEIASPATFAAFTRTRNGNIYGAARNAWRPGLQSPVPGLMLVGGGTDVGAGIEAVVISGTRAANLISESQTAKTWS